MQSYRNSFLPATRPLRRFTSTTSSKMPCYIATAPSRAPRHAYHGGLSPWAVRGSGPVSPFAELTSTLQPFFKLLDDELTGAAQPQQQTRLRSFQPRFDVREEDTAFHLQGELPGIDQKDITIEFKDEHTLVVSGRTVRESHSGSADKVAAAETAPAAAEQQEPAADAAETASDAGSNYHKPTVEDEFVDVAAESNPEKPAAAPTAEEKGKQVEKPQDSSPKEKYWVSERSVGQFHRSFTFPGHIDQEAVSASLKSGILNIVVPKAQQKEPRRIAIE